MNDPEVWKAIGNATPYNQNQEQEFFENVVSTDEGVHLLVVTEETPIGTIGLEQIDQRAGVAEIGYWIIPEQWDNGFGTEATELMVQYAFDQLRLHKVTARVFDFNHASQRLLETIGFSEEGIQREQVFINGEYHDTYWYGLLAHDWHEQTA